MRARARKAFTLVEILIVVVILGILAAIVVPQFTNATQDAQAGNLQTQLDTLQNQLELYKARNNVYPDIITNGWVDLTGGGYLKSAPKNPVNQLTTVDVPGTADVGWHWDAAGGNLGAAYFDENTGKVTPGVP
jgi:general secretion pathway protein G